MDINRYTPHYSLNKKHMTRLADYSTEELFEILYATRQMKAKFIFHGSQRKERHCHKPILGLSKLCVE